VREKHLCGQARREQIRVKLRIALPRAYGLELEHAALQVRGEHPVLEALDAGQGLEVNLVETPQVTGQGVRLALDPIAADVLEEIVVRVHAIQRCMRRMGLV
jgi:hypothetical protein